MKIKSKRHVRLSYLRFSIGKKRKVLAWAIVIVVFSCAIFFSGTIAGEKGLLKRVRRIAYLCTKVTPRFAKSLTSDPDRISIDIKHKDFQKLAYLREVALKKGLIITTEDSYIPAKVTFNGKTVKTDIRLKGDIANHVKGDKWSLRIKVKGDETIYGMKRFSIQDPMTSGYLYEWILHKLYEYEGLISLRYKYVDVTINGKSKGVYALEESFSKELIENNRRREGAIVKFDENGLWDGTARNKGSVKTQADIFFASDVDSFRTKKTMEDDVLRGNYLTAKQLLENFRQGNNSVSDTFDIKKLARLYALAELTKTPHALRWKNVRFYYNPIIRKIEPIGYNAYGNIKRIGVINSITFNNYSDRYNVPQYHDLFFQDENFFNSYINELNRISDKGYLDKFFESIKDELKENLSIIYRDSPWFMLDKKDYYSNMTTIRQTLIPAIPLKAKIKKDDAAGGEGRITFFAANTGFMPVKLDSIEIKKDQTSQVFKLKPQTLSGKESSKALVYQQIYLADDFAFKIPDANDVQVNVNYHVSSLPDRSFSSKFEIVEVDLSETLFLSDTEKLLDDLSKKDMLKVDRGNRIIAVLPGSWDIRENLVIPAGFTFTCGPETKLNLLSSAMIVSNSPLAFAGTEHSPILVGSSDAAGQGLVVLNCQEKSSLKHVVFQNLSNPVEGYWRLTGAVTFYESPVDISDCKFTGNHSEDSLNIIRTDFTIDNAIFADCFSDAFDADFCKGVISNCSFTNIGNDAVDVSGTEIELRGISINKVGDKGISIGEKSIAKAFDLKIKNTEIPVTSKDLSQIVIDGVDISDSKIGFALYRKKPEFGPASVIVKNLKMSNIEQDYLLEKGSNLIIDRVKIQPNHESVSEILYGVEYGKSSK